MNKAEILQTIIFAIKLKYGINEYGCYINGEWLSTQNIIDIIEDCFKNDIYL